MDLELLKTDLQNTYSIDEGSIEERVKDLLNYFKKNTSKDINEISMHEIQVLSSVILEKETNALQDEVQSLLAQKEQIERKIERQSQALQEAKYKIFNTLESEFDPLNEQSLARLHQVKLQTIDLYELLGEIVESAIITALEKDVEIDETIEEVVKDITFEAIKEGSLNTIRIRKILSTILQSSIDIAEAQPVKAHEILSPTLRGMRSGLLHAITRFKQRLAYIPVEAKHILIEDYDTILEDLNQSDSLFAQVVKTRAENSSSEIEKNLEAINKEMKYDLEELLRTSKETAEVMKERFAALAIQTMRKADKALHSTKAQEAKRLGKQAIGVAKNAIDNALQSAKEAIDKKK